MGGLSREWEAESTLGLARTAPSGQSDAMKQFIDRILRRTPAAPPVDIPTWTEIKGVLFPAFDPVLERHGLYRQKRGMLWTEKESNDDGIRRFFHLYALKGAAIVPGWGMSLDFVPHVTGDKVGWRRTFASAGPDIWVNTHLRDEEFTYLYGLGHLEGQIATRRKIALEKAEAFWGSAKTLRQLPQQCADIIAWRSKTPSATPAEMNPQLYLAHAFVLAKNHDMENATKMLKTYIAQMGAGLAPVAADTLRVRLREVG